MTAIRLPPPDLIDQLRAWAPAMYGPGATISDLEVLPGHAGLTYGLGVVDASGALIEELVLRLPPADVRRQANTDVLRQAPILETMHLAGIPVAPVRFASDDEQWFRVPYLVVARVPGATVSIDGGDAPPARAHFLEAIGVLAALHDVRWEDRLNEWSTPRRYGDEVRSWDRTLDKAHTTDWHGTARQVRDALLANEPPAPRIGIVHGDFQFTNLLFDGERLVAVLDWEISGIGPRLLDVGWFLVINDRRSWAFDVALAERPSDLELRDAYEQSAGRSVDDGELAYACALSAYRAAVIFGLNVALHRSGRRVDEHWEHIAPSIPILLDRALADLNGG